MIVDQKPYAGLVGIIVVLLVAGLVLGVAVSNMDIFNANRSANETWVRDLENQTVAQKAEIDMAYYRAARAADEEKLQLEVVAKQRELEQDLRLVELSHYVWLGVGGLSLLSVSTGITTFLIFYGRRYVVLAKTPKKVSDGNWRDPSWRAEQIRLARERERETTHVNGNGSH